MAPTGVAPGAPARHKRAADGGQVADGHDKSPSRRGGIDGVGKTSAEVSPRQAMPPDTSELDDSIGTPPARDGAAGTVQVDAIDEGETGDSLQGTDLLSMMEEAGEEELELETELELEAQQQQQGKKKKKRGGKSGAARKAQAKKLAATQQRGSAVLD
jgi:hypothetical protein